MYCVCICFFFFKQKTAYEMRISDWSSDVCSSDLLVTATAGVAEEQQDLQPQGLRRQTEGGCHMKAKWIALGIAAVLALPISGAGAAEIRVGFSSDALTLDPANHRDRETETIIRNMHDGLQTRDSAMKEIGRANV